MNIDKLKRLFESSTNKYGDAEKIGITYEAMRKILGGADPKVSTLEKIARFYNVPVGYFFDETSADGRASHELEIENLKGQIKGMQNALDKFGMVLENFVPKKVRKGR